MNEAAYSAFAAELRAQGVIPPSPESLRTDGEPTRWSSTGKAGNDAGWSRFHETNGVVHGEWRDYRTGAHGYFRHAGKRLTPAEEAEVRRSIEAARLAREAEDKRRHAAARKLAKAKWDAAKQATANHPALKRKGVKPCGARVHGNAVIVSAIDEHGVIQSTQELFDDGSKRFAKDSAVKGCFHPIGDPASPTIVICEGFATGASLHEATGYAVIVAFHAGNLLPVAQAIRKLYPDRRIIVAADDDYQSQINIGIVKATEAARAVGAEIAVPNFGAERPEGATDWNDVHQAFGLDAVRVGVEEAAPPKDAVPDSWPAPIDFAARGAPQPPKAIMELLYAGYVTLLSAHGGAGKSSIALFLAVCIALRLSWWGFPVERRKVLFLSCEDRADVLHWRLHHICAFLGVDISDLQGRLVVMDLVGHDAVLYSSDFRGSGPTENYYVLKARIDKEEAEVLIIDGATDVLAINENDRGAVKRGINALAGLVPADTGAVLLIAHLDKATAKGGGTRETYSGSTAWHNGVRVRASITPLVTDEGERTGKQILEVFKSNYGAAGAQIEFEWSPEAHLFVGKPLTAATVQERGKQEQEERNGILATLRACTAAMVVVPAATTGPRTAFHVLSQHSEFPDSLKNGKAAVRRFWRHVESLRHNGDVREAEHKRANGHKTVQLLAREPSNQERKF